MKKDQPAESLELTSREGDQLVAPAAPSDPVLKMIEKVVNGGVTEANVAALDKLLDVYERLADKDAERQFAAAFVRLQADLPAIQATKPVPNNDGTIRYKFAPFELIMEAVKPVLQRHGFAVTFSSDVKEGRVVQTCTLQHVGGHKRQNSFGARIGRGPPGSSEAQGDGAASTYAKRFALCDALNITVERDQDARAEGAPISADKAIYLREKVRETKSDEKMFLALAGAATYEEISEDKYDVLVQALAKKERRAAQQ